MIATLLSALLGAMVLLASASSTPSVRISEISLLDDGQEAITSGILVDLRVFDSGAEALLLTDDADGAVLKVISSPGIRPQPSSYVDIGDEVRVLGEVSNSRVLSIMYSSSDRVNLRRASEYVLTVEILSRNWLLFQGDEFRICGLLAVDASNETLRLSDSDTDHSISLRSHGQDVSRLMSKKVVVEGILRFDSSSMGFYIDAGSISIAHDNPFLDVQRWALPWHPHCSPSMTQIHLTGCALHTWLPWSSRHWLTTI
jgi:hypothetical protein